jgi:hypothetical protein
LTDAVLKVVLTPDRHRVADGVSDVRIGDVLFGTTG